MSQHRPFKHKTAPKKVAPADKAEAYTGVLERIIFSNEENHFTIGEFRPAKTEENITITGQLPGVQCGETLKIEGEWVENRQFGAQFQIKSFSSSLPSSVYGIRKYLGSGLVPGIGRKMADKIVDHFGEDTLRVISEESGRLQEVPKIGKKRAREIKKAWDEQRAIRDVMMFLQTYGVGNAQCIRLVKNYGYEAAHIVQTEPYRVASEIDGIGFKTADKIARNLGFANDSPARVDAGLLYLLDEAESEGHTCAESADLANTAAELLEVHADLPRERLRHLVAEDYLVETAPGVVQLPASDRAERTITRSVERLLAHESSLPPIQIDKAIAWAQEKAGFGFAEEQAQGIRAALEGKLSILTGGPGTGKTTILRALVEILRAKNVSLLLAAPTGRAAQRMSETTGRNAQTIHRLLKFDAAAGKFVHNEENPIKAGFIIVDEASMLDSKLAAALFRAVPGDAHLLLVGDIYQLPSVGAGNVLGDLIHSRRARTVTLARIFRQEARSTIVTTAHAILQGVPTPPLICDRFRDRSPDSDLYFMKADEPEQCVRGVIALCRDYLPEAYGVDAVRDIQVLAPMHKGLAGVSNLNRELQGSLNPDAPGVSYGAIRFQVGDKVIQNRNNYDANIYNGDLGTITHINAEAGTLAARFDTGLVEFERGQMADLSLAYAITVHKSQGSEFPLVVIPLLKQHFIMLQRNLLYTAITRGRKKVFLVGDPVAYSMAVNNNESIARRTSLRARLHG